MLLALYRVVLWACPADVRRDLGADMEAGFLFGLELARARHGRWRQPFVWGRAFADALVFAVTARRDAAQGRPFVVGDRSPRSRRPLMRLQDFRSTLRLMRTSPLFTAAIVGMLAIGIGATSSIFSVIYGVLLRPLPFPQPERVVAVYGTATSRQIAQHSLTEANLWDMRDMNRSFAEFGAWHGASFTLASDASPLRVSGARVTAGFFRALGVTPVQGRLFAPGEDDPGAPGTLVMLSHAFWTRQFNADPALVGRTIMLDRRAYQVVGVLPPGTPWLDGAEVFVPQVRRPNANRGSWEYSGVARLKDGVTFEAARADMDRLGLELAAAYPKDNQGQGITIARSEDWIASDTLRRTLWVLLGSVAVLLVIACVNVTNLLLARASARVRETAVRAALGASRADLIRERLTESLVFSTTGAIAGWLLAIGALQALRALAPPGIPRMADVALNGWTLAFTIAVTLVVGLLTGLVPALSAPMGDVVPALRQSQRGSVGDRKSDRLRTIFVCAEVALSLMLLVGAGLLVRSLVAVVQADRGFTTEQRLLATVSVPGAYPEMRRAQIATDLLARVQALPQIVSAAYVSGRPLRGGGTGLGIVADDHPEIADADVPWASWRLITRDYFKTMGMQIVAGRGFTEQDLIEKPWRVIISQRLATKLWPGENAVGKTAILWKGQSNTKGEVIGVVSDMREQSIETDPTLATYFPAYGALGGTTIELVVHTQGRTEEVVPALRATLADIDPTLPISGVRTLEELVTRSLATRRFTLVLLMVFAGLALVLALAGVYGVLAYTVARRTAEYGVRLALGASPAHVLRRTFTRGMRPVAIGLLIGCAGMFWLSRLMTSLLFGVQPGDVVTYIVVTLGLLVTAALACYLPARQVLRVDPVVALRAE